MKKRILCILLAVMLLPLGASAEEVSFYDVNASDWFYESVMASARLGIINGVGNNLFNPNGTLTHAEAMTMMAKVYASYHDDTEALLEAQTVGEGHWALGIREYCKENELPVPSSADFDTQIKRRTMAGYFYSALPKEEFETGVLNQITGEYKFTEIESYSSIKALYEIGVMIGDESGFRIHDTITRAEAAAIIHRVASKEARVKVAPPAEKPPFQVIPGEVQTDKPYLRIPNTSWTSDPTGGITVSSQAGYSINTKYGNHNYGCANQEQYDKVMSVIDEAFIYASEAEIARFYRGGGGPLKYYVKGTFLKFYRDEVGYTDENQMMSMGITEDFVSNMATYLMKNYAFKNNYGSNTDADNNNVYKALFAGGYLDCDGYARLYMLCYDYLGFSTRMIGSYNIKHAAAQVYVNGEWLLVDQSSGKLDNVTHSQIKELMSGIKNDAYEDDVLSSADMIVKVASTSPERLYDLSIHWNETPTHDPGNSSL